MADKPDNETTENVGEQAPEAEAQTPEPTEAATPEAETPAAEAPAAETPAESPAAEIPEAPEPEASAAPAVQGAPAEPEEQLSSKERRRKARSTHSGEAAPARSPEDRHAARLTERRAKAVSRRARGLTRTAKGSVELRVSNNDSCVTWAFIAVNHTRFAGREMPRPQRWIKVASCR